MKNEIVNPDDILDILRDNPNFDDWQRYGDVNTKIAGNYILFNYSAQAQYAGRWNAFERMSRGLIVDRKALKVMARPFDKFFNWGEFEPVGDSDIQYVMPKFDGSLGVCWFDVYQNNWRITTRGSFDSEQALWATEFLRTKLGHKIESLDSAFTHLFEIIYPENRIVVDYGDFAGLILLGIRQNNAGYGYLDNPYQMELIANLIECKCASRYSYSNIQEILNLLPQLKGVQNEGFVAVMTDGTRWKFKGADYLRIHKVISTFSFKHTLKAVAAGTFNEWLEGIPDEFLSDIRTWHESILKEFAIAKQLIKDKFWKLEPLSHNRKMFASVALGVYPELAPFLFRKLDDKLTDEFIWQKWNFDHCETYTRDTRHMALDNSHSA